MSTTTSDLPEVLTVDETAALLRLDRKTGAAISKAERLAIAGVVAPIIRDGIKKGGKRKITVTELYSHLLPEHLSRARNAVNIGPSLKTMAPAMAEKGQSR